MKEKLYINRVITELIIDRWSNSFNRIVLESIKLLWECSSVHWLSEEESMRRVRRREPIFSLWWMFLLFRYFCLVEVMLPIGRENSSAFELEIAIWSYAQIRGIPRPSRKRSRAMEKSSFGSYVNVRKTFNFKRFPNKETLEVWFAFRCFRYRVWRRTFVPSFQFRNAKMESKQSPSCPFLV